MTNETFQVIASEEDNESFYRPANARTLGFFRKLKSDCLVNNVDLISEETLETLANCFDIEIVEE